MCKIIKGFWAIHKITNNYKNIELKYTKYNKGVL